MEISGKTIDTMREAHVLCLDMKRLEHLREVEGRDVRLRGPLSYGQAPDTRACANIENTSWSAC